MEARCESNSAKREENSDLCEVFYRGLVWSLEDDKRRHPGEIIAQTLGKLLILSIWAPHL